MGRPVTDMAASPLVTVIVRSMDRPHLADALACLAAQDYPHLEVLVVDATGGRHAPLTALPLAAGHTMRLVSAGRRLPRAQAADVGLASATGEWLSFLDDDDTCAPTHVSGLVAAAQAHPAALVVYGCGRLLDRHGHLDKVFGRPFNRALMHFGPLFYWQASLIRTDVRALGCRFDIEFDVCEDRDFLAQIATHGDFVFIPDLATFNYRPDLGTSGTGDGPNRDYPKVARYENLLRAKWAGPGTWHNERVAVRCRRAVLAFQAGDVALADAIFASVLVDYPDDPNALHGLAHVALARGERERAQALARTALEINPLADEYRATWLAAGGIPEAPPAAAPASSPVPPPVSRMAACPCGSGRKYKACCGRLEALAAAPVDPVVPLCREAREALDAGRADAAFEILQRAAAIRCDAVVGRLLEDCCARLADPRAQASLRAWARDTSLLLDDSAGTAPAGPMGAGAAARARDIVVVGDVTHEAALREGLFRAGASDAPRRAVATLAAAGPLGDTAWVIFGDPADVPAHGVDGNGPTHAIVLSRGADAAPLVRALARLFDGWPQTARAYLIVSV